jgi:hypothetical protein
MDQLSNGHDEGVKRYFVFGVFGIVFLSGELSSTVMWGIV